MGCPQCGQDLAAFATTWPQALQFMVCLSLGLWLTAVDELPIDIELLSPISPMLILIPDTFCVFCCFNEPSSFSTSHSRSFNNSFNFLLLGAMLPPMTLTSQSEGRFSLRPRTLAPLP